MMASPMLLVLGLCSHFGRTQLLICQYEHMLVDIDKGGDCVNTSIRSRIGLRRDRADAR